VASDVAGEKRDAEQDLADLASRRAAQPGADLEDVDLDGPMRHVEDAFGKGARFDPFPSRGDALGVALLAAAAGAFFLAALSRSGGGDVFTHALGAGVATSVVGGLVLFRRFTARMAIAATFPLVVVTGKLAFAAVRAPMATLLVVGAIAAGLAWAWRAGADAPDDGAALPGAPASWSDLWKRLNEKAGESARGLLGGLVLVWISAQGVWQGHKPPEGPPPAVAFSKDGLGRWLESSPIGYYALLAVAAVLGVLLLRACSKDLLLEVVRFRATLLRDLPARERQSVRRTLRAVCVAAAGFVAVLWL
jgi:hypothetical protein